MYILFNQNSILFIVKYFNDKLNVHADNIKSNGT